MENQKQTTGLLIKLQLDEKLTERLLIILISSFLSFIGGMTYTSKNDIEEPSLTADKAKIILQQNEGKVN